MGRASAALSRLGDNEVVELIASVIANLVEGEILQLREVIKANSEREVDVSSTKEDVGREEEEMEL